MYLIQHPFTHSGAPSVPSLCPASCWCLLLVLLLLLVLCSLMLVRQGGSPFARTGVITTDSLMTCYTRHLARTISAVQPGYVSVYGRA